MAIGLYGKLPSQGDFVSRRLPWEVAAAWDDWMQDGIARARERLGADWNKRYLSAPLWRLQLAPGVLGAGAWIGVWFASVDRVGRQFPLALLEPLPVGSASRYALVEHDATFFAVEDAALRALDPRLAFDAFDQSLHGLSLLDSDAVDPRRLAAAAPQSNAGLPAGAIRLPVDADAGAALRAAEAAGPPASCFFSWGNEQHEPVLLRCDGLPAADRFQHFFDGRWA